MSASTVSITANAASRRRPVIVGDKKSSHELFSNETQLNVGDDRVTTATKDPRNQLTRDAVVLERSTKEFTQVTKVAPSSTISPRRSRKGSVKRPEKPLWLKLVSIFTKNLLLFVVLIGLVQLVRKLALNFGDPGLVRQIGLSELEGRISEVERTMKSTSKMIQSQVDIVDKKIEIEVGSLEKKVNKKIEENGKFVEDELKKLAVKNEQLEGLFSKLNMDDWLSKKDYDKFLEDLKKSNTADEVVENLDDIRAYARHLVVNEIEKHAADGIGRVDYALASGGAKVLKHSEPYPGYRIKWFPTNLFGNEAIKMLMPSFGEPGQCFSLNGSCGFVEIMLRKAIVFEAVTLEHVAKSVAYDRSSAPKDCRVFGWLQHPNVTTSTAAGIENMNLLTEFSYDLEKSSVQTFNVLDSAASSTVDTIRFEFESNHGHSAFTCIYRLRVHGRPLDSTIAAV